MWKLSCSAIASMSASVPEMCALTKWLLDKLLGRACTYNARTYGVVCLGETEWGESRACSESMDDRDAHIPARRVLHRVVDALCRDAMQSCTKKFQKGMLTMCKQVSIKFERQRLELDNVGGFGPT